MSMSAVLSAVRGAGRQQLSASIVAARPVSASHVLRIDGYSQISKMLATGQATRSGTFSVGGHDWRIKCYPNGCLKQHEGSISIFLEHVSHAKTDDTTAKMELSVLVDETSKPSNRKTTDELRFSKDACTWGWRDFIKHKDLDAEKHLKDDCLTILCDVTVSGPDTNDHIEVAVPQPPEPRSDVFSPAPPFDLHGQLGEAIWNKEEVDLEIEVGGETFPAHRWILKARSPVFKKDLSIASATIGDALRLHVDDMDAEVFKALLQFIYTDSTPPLEASTVTERLLVAADRYELEQLKLICEKTLCRHIDMSSVAAALALAERHHCSVLRTACVQFLSSPGNLQAFVASGGFEQLRTGCPSALLEFLVKNMMRQQQL